MYHMVSKCFMIHKYSNQPWKISQDMSATDSQKVTNPGGGGQCLFTSLSSERGGLNGGMWCPSKWLSDGRGPQMAYAGVNPDRLQNRGGITRDCVKERRRLCEQQGRLLEQVFKLTACCCFICHQFWQLLAQKRRNKMFKTHRRQKEGFRDNHFWKIWSCFK